MIGVFICTCRDRLLTKSALARFCNSIVSPAAGRQAGDAGPRVFTHEALCSPDGMGFIAAHAEREGLRKLAVTGCAAVASEGYARALSARAGLTSGCLVPIVMGKGAVGTAIADTRRALAVLALTPVFQRKSMPVRQEVLVVGGGPAGMEVARELAALGFPTTLVEKTPGLDGDHLPAGSSAAVEGLEIIRGATLASLSGSVGDFTAVLSRGSLTVTRRFGAIVIASGVSLRGSGREPFLPGTVIPLPDLDAHLAGLAKRDLPASIAILLDMEHDETIASAETAFRSCLSLRSRYQSDVTLLLRDARVSSLGLETLYDQAREAGVTVAKYGEKPSLRSSGPGVTVSFLDGVLGEEVEMSFGLVAVSPYGLPAPADRSLAEAAGITLDALAHMQENNVHLLPERSNRPGVFLVGSCRGEAHVPTILRDARNAALSVHSLLSLKSIEVELSHAVVDGDKCALCLTCVRSCPFKAMRVFAEEKRADCAPQACRRCGLCVGECPNRAITLPAYSEAIVLARAGA